MVKALQLDLVDPKLLWLSPLILGWSAFLQRPEAYSTSKPLAPKSSSLRRPALPAETLRQARRM